MPPRKGNGCSPQFPRDSVAAALAPPPLLKLTPHPLQGGHTLLPFHSIHRLPSKLLAQTMLSQGSSSFHACLPERHDCPPPAAYASSPSSLCNDAYGAPECPHPSSSVPPWSCPPRSPDHEAPRASEDFRTRPSARYESPESMPAVGRWSGACASGCPLASRLGSHSG